MLTRWLSRVCGMLALITSSVWATTPLLTQPDITSCPSEFHRVKVHDGAKQCQRFDAELPASLIYFVADTPDSLVAYYLAVMPDLALKASVNNRVLLVNDQKHIRVVVSPDKNGSQIDILVTAKSSDQMEDSSPEELSQIQKVKGA